MSYSANAISSGTRVRQDHNTFSAIVRSLGADDKIEGDEIWIAPADGSEVKAGDKWLKVLKVNSVPISPTGWTAIIHKGQAICKNFVDNGTPPPDPTPSQIPKRLHVTDPDGNWKAEFQFVKEL